MIDIQGFTEIDKIISAVAASSDSVFFDIMMTYLSSIYVWIPTLILIAVIILRNNYKNNALVIFACIASSIIGVYFLSRYVIYISIRSALAWCLSIFLIFLFKSWLSSFVFLLLSTIQSFVSIFNGECRFGMFLSGLATGFIVAILLYLIYAILTNNRTKYIKSSNNNIYSRSGYLVNDLRLIVITVCVTFLVLIFLTVITA